MQKKSVAVVIVLILIFVGMSACLKLDNKEVPKELDSKDDSIVVISGETSLDFIDAKVTGKKVSEKEWSYTTKLTSNENSPQFIDECRYRNFMMCFSIEYAKIVVYKDFNIARLYHNTTHSESCGRVSYNIKEWVVTNGLGGYASSTILGINTRKYHGLLVASFNPPVDRRVLLSKLDEAIVIGDNIHKIGSNEFKSGIHPKEAQFISDS